MRCFEMRFRYCFHCVPQFSSWGISMSSINIWNVQKKAALPLLTSFCPRSSILDPRPPGPRSRGRHFSRAPSGVLAPSGGAAGRFWFSLGGVFVLGGAVLLRCKKTCFLSIKVLCGISWGFLRCKKSRHLCQSNTFAKAAPGSLWTDLHHNTSGRIDLNALRLLGYSATRFVIKQNW